MLDLFQKNMRNLITLSFLLFLACNTKDKSENTKNAIQNPEELYAIKTMLKTQQTCWNNGDIDGFMQGYWNSENLIFTSLNHKPAYGWENTLKRYKNSYPNKESMGELKFKIINLELISKTSATLKGEWTLIREKDQPNGLFWLDVEKIDANWLITKDSTISFETNTPL